MAWQARHGSQQRLYEAVTDYVRAEVPKGKKAGVHVGRVAVRRTGSFNIQTQGGTVQGISYRHCRLLQRADGYGYSFQPKPNTEEARRAA
ncbi:hypothetical protein Atep_30010 (plasmid) [Allochromatium tepidum]|uniref:HNH endonuclease n=1 Tax=Allochromatium tepidum TaxID=553982 RepID=A0ABN6GEJ3_9GAMM|nr:hypothetical protein Atep_30010 [Allochromatium tepidum]